MTLRIGIVGAGENTKLQHIPGFKSIEDVEVVAVCNRTEASGEKVAEEFGIPVVYKDWNELVNSDQIDAVCVGTWPYLHSPITIKALSSGKHVLTEARMCMNLKEAQAMHEAAEQSDCVAMVVPAPFYLTAEPTLLSMLKKDFFGEILEIEVRGLAGGFDPNAPLHWRQRRDLSGQNIMALGIFNETVRRYVGHEKSVMAHATIFTHERIDSETGMKRVADVPESIGVISEMENGATAVYHLSSVARFGDSFTFEFYGTKGCFKMEGGTAFNPGKVWVAGESDEAPRLLELREQPRNGWRVEEEFVDAIREGKPVTHTNFTDGLRYMEFTEAVQMSLAEGRKVNLSEL